MGDNLSISTKLSLMSSSVYYGTKHYLGRFLSPAQFSLPAGDSVDVSILGETYRAPTRTDSTRGEGESSTSAPSTSSASTPTQLAQRRAQRFLWMTYRTGFAPLPGCNLSTDVGWGCTLRSTQMLAAEAMLRVALFNRGAGLSQRPQQAQEATPPLPSHLSTEPALQGIPPDDSKSDVPTIDLATPASDEDEAAVLRVLRCFLDLPQGPAALSLHNLISYGRGFQDQIRPGSWFGPYSSCTLLRAALQGSRRRLREALPPGGMRVVLVSEPGGGAPCVSRPLVEAEGTRGSTGRGRGEGEGGARREGAEGEEEGEGEGEASSGSLAERRGEEAPPTLPPAPAPWTPVLLLLPLHLGLGSAVNPVYVAQVQGVLTWPQSVGIVGGRPSRSFFFVGCQGDHVLYLDPHESQEAARGPEVDAALRDTYRCRTLHSMRASELDPSMALGFLITSPEDLEDFRMRTEGLGREEEGANATESVQGVEGMAGLSLGSPSAKKGNAAVLFTWSDDLPSPKHRRVQSGAPSGLTVEGENDWELL